MNTNPCQATNGVGQSEEERASCPISRGGEAFLLSSVEPSERFSRLLVSPVEWPEEVTFHDAKQPLGIGEPQNRRPAAVERTAAMGLLLYI